MASTPDNWQRIAQYEQEQRLSENIVLQPSRRTNNRQHSRASTFTLGMRRSLDFSTLAEGNGKRHSRAGTAASNLSGSTNMAGEPDGNGNSSSSRWGTVSTSSLAGLVGSGSSSSRFGTVASGISNSNNKRARGGVAGGFSLGGLFSPSKGSATGAAATGSTPAATAGMEGEAREEALVEGLRAAHDEHTTWEITVLPISDPDKLFQPSSATGASVQGGPSEQLSASTSFSSNLVRMLSPGARDTKKRGLGWSSNSSSSSAPRPHGESTPSLLAVCVSTGVTSLTLYRTIAQIAVLDAEVNTPFSPYADTS